MPVFIAAAPALDWIIEILLPGQSVANVTKKILRCLKFELALLNLAKTQAVYEIIKTVHGVKSVIIGSINTPLGKSVTILSVWIVDTGENTPRFASARPYKLS